LYNLIISGLLQLDNAKKVNDDNTYKLVSFKITDEIEKKAIAAMKRDFKTDDDKRDISIYDNLKNIAYLVDIGKLSTFKHINDLRWINSSGKYANTYSLYSIIKSYIDLTDDEKKELEKFRKQNKKNLDKRDILYKFLIRIQKAIHYIYPAKKDENNVLQKLGNLEMLPPVSALLVLTYNTLKLINPIDTYETTK